MIKSQRIVLTFLLGTLLGGALVKPVQAAGDEVSGVVRQLTRIADELGQIRRDGLSCH